MHSNHLLNGTMQYHEGTFHARLPFMSYLEDNSRTGRVLLPDLVRAFALLGIVLVNVAFFAFPGELTYHAGGLNSALDNAAYFGVNALFLFKSYTLFSFMFGVGLAYQMLSAEQRGVQFTASYFRRLTGLIILGILHVTLAFQGDILIFYGILGIGLYFFRNASQKTLVTTGIVLVIVQVLIALLFSVSLYLGDVYSPDEMKTLGDDIQRNTVAAISVHSNGDFTEIASRRWGDWLGMLQFVLPLQGPGVFAFFLFGLAAVGSGVLTDATAPLWSKSRRVYLPIGLLISVVGATIYVISDNPISSGGLFSYALIVLAAPFSSLGYIGLIAKWSAQPTSAFKVFVARGGTASLTAYLLQSLILSLIFCGYGLGLYSKLGAFACISIAFVVGSLTISFASIWRTRFKLGPMEILLRRWTYLGQR